MRRTLFAAVLALAAAVFVPAWPSHQTSAAAAMPTPAALQYDEIVRTIIAPATPPAPGTFQADYASIVNSAQSSSGSSTPAPKRGGLSSLLSGVMGGQNGQPDMGDAMNKLNEMRAGMISRYTYYKGWLRTEYPTLQTATISKCAEHQFITLDLAKKTYTMQNTQPACPTNVPMPGGQGGTQTENLAPGTADVTLTATRSDLGPLTIDTIPTTGFDSAMSMSTTNATGSCKDGSFSMQMERYISKIAVPRSYCPISRSRQMENPGNVVVRGGCKPTMHMNGSVSSMAEPDTLVMYSKTGMGGAQGRGVNMAFVIERGNVKWLSGSDADALFAVPAGFTQAAQGQ